MWSVLCTLCRHALTLPSRISFRLSTLQDALSSERETLASRLGELTDSVRMMQREAHCRLIAQPRQHRRSEPAVSSNSSRGSRKRLERSPSAISTVSSISYTSLDSRLLNDSIEEFPDGVVSSPRLHGLLSTNSRPNSAKQTLTLPRVRHVRSGSLGSEKLFSLQQKLVLAKSESIVNLSEARSCASNPGTPVLNKKASALADFHQLEVRRSSATGQLEPMASRLYTSKLQGSCTSIDSLGRSPSIMRKRLLSIQTAV